jgi:hypothetical protein
MAKTKPYNPYAYVPGGSSQKVSQAIQNQGYAEPGPNPVQIPQYTPPPADPAPDEGEPYNPWAYAPGQGTADSPVPAAIQAAGYAEPGPNPVYIPQAPTGAGAPGDPNNQFPANGSQGGGSQGGVQGGHWVIHPGTAATSTPRKLSLQDYMNMAQASPMWGTGQGAYDTSLARGRENLVRDPTRLATINYGHFDINKVPEQYKSAVSDLLDQTTLDAADRNPTSTMAILKQVLDRSNAAIPYQLHGQRSGGAAVLGRRADEANTLGTNKAMQTLLGVLTQGEGQFSTYSSDALAKWEALQQQIVSALASDPNNTPVDTTPGTAATQEWVPGYADEFMPPTSGNEAGYTPAGVYNPDTGQIDVPGAGSYTRQGSDVYYQSLQGPYGYKPQY